MKVAINRSFGGFGLSTKALIKLYELNSAILKKTPIAEYFGKSNIKDIDIHWETVHDGYVLDLKNSHSEEIRCNSDLIKIIEELKEESFGQYAKLDIVEVPDGTEFEIEEYDGKEHVAEVHNKWF